MGCRRGKRRGRKVGKKKRKKEKKKAKGDGGKMKVEVEKRKEGVIHKSRARSPGGGGRIIDEEEVGRRKGGSV